MPNRFDRLPEALAWVEPTAMFANPAYPLLMCYRIALGGQQDFLGPFWSQLGIFSLWAVLFLVLGYSSFTANKHKYADLI